MVPRFVFDEMTQLQTLRLCEMIIKGKRNFSALTQLRALELHGSYIMNNGFSCVWQLTQLTRLVMLCCQTTGQKTAEQHDSLSRLVALRELSLRQWRPHDTTLSHLTNLTKLNMHYDLLVPALSVGIRRSIARLTQLTRLSVSASVRTLETLAPLTNLTRLRLTEATAGDINTLLQQLPVAPRLRRLTCSLLSAPDCVLALGHMTSLQKLSVRATRPGNTLTSPRLLGLEQLSGSLDTLELDGVIHVSLDTLKQLSSLTALDMGHTTLETNGIRPSTLYSVLTPQSLLLWQHACQCWQQSPLMLVNRACSYDCPQHSLRLLCAKSHDQTIRALGDASLRYLERALQATTAFPVY
jgi:hypothetical protein